MEKPAAEKKEGKSSETRKDLPKMEHGGDEKKDAEAHGRALAQLKKEGFVVGKDNLLHHEDGRVAKINTKTGEWEISKEVFEKKEFSKDDEQFLKNFFDPMSAVDAFENEYKGEDAKIEDFEKFMVSGGQAEAMGVDTLMSELNLSNKEATDLFRERSKELIEKVKENPEKYGF